MSVIQHRKGPFLLKETVRKLERNLENLTFKPGVDVIWTALPREIELPHKLPA